jgi:hypothetical protein
VLQSEQGLRTASQVAVQWDISQMSFLSLFVY